MGYALLWIENLTVSLLLLATVLACVGRFRWRWLRCGLWAAVVLALVLFYASLTWATALFQFRTGFVATWFYPALTLAVGVLVGIVWLSVVGFRRVDGVAVPIAAGTWPRGKLAMALGVALALHAMTFWNLDLAARQQLSALRTEAGTVAMSVAPPRIPDRDNAAIAYERAFDGFAPQSWDETLRKKFECWGSPDFDVKDPELRRFLKSQQMTIGLLHEAARKPGCWFERDYARPSHLMAIPEVQQLRVAAHLLARDARVNAADGDTLAAVNDVKAMFSISQHVGEGPLPICLLISVMIQQMAAETLQEILAGNQISEEELALLNAEEYPACQRLFERGVRMAEAFQLALLSDVGSGRVGFGELAFQIGASLHEEKDAIWNCQAFNIIYRVFLLTDDVADQRRLSRQCHALIAQPYSETRLQWQSIEDQFHDGPAGLLTTMIVPPLGRCAELAAAADARWRDVRLALAMERYRIAHSQFPAQLDDLVPEFIPAVPLDPFDGKPMRMRHTDHRWIIYSIGPDMVDNGGEKYDQKHKTGDVTFELSDAPQP